MASNGNTNFKVEMGPISTSRITYICHKKSIVSSLTMKGACWTTILLVVKYFLFAWFLVGVKPGKTDTMGSLWIKTPVRDLGTLSNFCDLGSANSKLEISSFMHEWTNVTFMHFYTSPFLQISIFNINALFPYSFPIIKMEKKKRKLI